MLIESGTDATAVGIVALRVISADDATSECDFAKGPNAAATGAFPTSLKELSSLTPSYPAITTAYNANPMMGVR